MRSGEKIIDDEHRDVGTVVSFDDQADMVCVRLPPRERLVETHKVGSSVLASYTSEHRLACVEVLTMKAFGRPGNLEILEELLPPRAYRLLTWSLSARGLI